MPNTYLFTFMMHWSDTIMAKKVNKNDLKELVAKCIKLTFPYDGYPPCSPSLSHLKKDIIVDSIYIEIRDSGSYSKGDIRRLNKYFCRYAGKNLVCKYWDEDKNVLIIKNDYQVID